MQNARAAEARLPTFRITHRVMPEIVIAIHTAGIQAVAIDGSELLLEPNQVDSRAGLQLHLN